MHNGQLYIFIIFFFFGHGTFQLSTYTRHLFIGEEIDFATHVGTYVGTTPESIVYVITILGKGHENLTIFPRNQPNVNNDITIYIYIYILMELNYRPRAFIPSLSQQQRMSLFILFISKFKLALNSINERFQ